MTNELSGDRVIDVRGLGCGSVLVRLAALRRSLTHDASFLIWTDDVGADEELPAWCRMTGQHFGGRVDKVDEAWQFRLTLSPPTTTQSIH
jgi:TusA-related sulfurtransferase